MTAMKWGSKSCYPAFLQDILCKLLGEIALSSLLSLSNKAAPCLQWLPELLEAGARFSSQHLKSGINSTSHIILNYMQLPLGSLAARDRPRGGVAMLVAVLH